MQVNYKILYVDKKLYKLYNTGNGIQSVLLIKSGINFTTRKDLGNCLCLFLLILFSLLKEDSDGTVCDYN